MKKLFLLIPFLFLLTACNAQEDTPVIDSSTKQSIEKMNEEEKAALDFDARTNSTSTPKVKRPSVNENSGVE